MALVDAIYHKRFSPSVLNLLHDLILPGRGLLARRFSFNPNELTIVTNQKVHRALAVTVRHRHEPVTFGVTIQHLSDGLLDLILGYAVLFFSHQTTRAMFAMHSSLGKSVICSVNVIG